MRNYKYFSIAFLFGFGAFFLMKPAGVSLFQSIGTVPQGRINYQTAMVHNCSFRTDLSGEVWLGWDIVTALKQPFQDVDMVFRDEQNAVYNSFGVHIYLRGYYKFNPPFPDDKHINISYLIYPVRFTQSNQKMIKNRDKIGLNKFGGIQLLYDELQFYDALAVGSKTYTEKLRKAGYKAYYVPQFTNPQKFYYDYDETLKSKVLFVGGKRSYGSAVAALEHKLPITIYGPDWGDTAKAEYVDNQILRKYYSSAKIVLNDHRPDMRENGFINNRTYDVTACGTLLISDYMPEIEAVYGDSIPMWKTEEELVALIKYYLDPAHEAERLEKAKRAQEITLKNFTTEQTARKFEAIIKEIRQNKD